MNKSASKVNKPNISHIKKWTMIIKELLNSYLSLYIFPNHSLLSMGRHKSFFVYSYQARQVFIYTSSSGGQKNYIKLPQYFTKVGRKRMVLRFPDQNSDQEFGVTSANIRFIVGIYIVNSYGHVSMQVKIGNDDEFYCHCIFTDTRQVEEENK